jgi:23S rRNA-/tRNA-specific pseudouridylate synthase
MTPPILLEDDGLILVNKPAGVPTAGDTLEQAGSMQRELMDHYRRMIWAVHQLDRDTSGLNLFVRRKALVAEWTEALKSGRKIYLAVCGARVGWEEREVRARLGWDPKRRRRAPRADGQDARSVFRVRARGESATLLEVEIATGRTHQIRLHLEHLGLRLLGEQVYGGGPCARAPRQMLHAWRVAAAGRVFEAPLPGDLEAALAREGLVWGKNDASV